MLFCLNALRRLRRPRCLIVLAAFVFVGTGTLYWSFGEIPWLMEDAGPVGDDDAWVVSAEDENPAPLRPKPLNCIREPSKVTPRNFCSWSSTLQGCHELLKPTLQNQATWVFLGDAGMANIPYFLSHDNMWPFGALNITTRRNPCQNLIYYGLPPPQQGWTPPDPEKGEGPIGTNTRPYCMDCSKCWNVYMASPSAPERSVEYLVVEYARDVSVPSVLTETTQETAMYYLARAPPSVCVANAGLNDAAIRPPITEAIYLQNADKFLALLQRTCDYVVWMTMHAVVEGPNVLQKNCKLQQWNHAFLEVLEFRNYDNVFVVDVFEKSFHTDYHEPTRLGNKYYASLARLFKSLMAAPDTING